MDYGVSRRGVLIGATAGLTAATIGQAADLGYDPRKSAEGQIKLGATLDGSPAYWIYHGVVYAVMPDQHPTALFGVSGCQATWADRQPDGSYTATGMILTYFRDLETNAVLDGFDNPITGKRNTAQANLLSGAKILFPADGSSSRVEVASKAGVVAPGGFRPADPKRALGGLRWHVYDKTVSLMTDRSWDVAVQPQLEAQTQTCDRAAFFDPAVKRMTTRFTATTIVPWMKWLEMGQTPGHLVWHSSGEKGFSIDGLDPEYRAKAGDLLTKLTTKPGV